MRAYRGWRTRCETSLASSNAISCHCCVSNCRIRSRKVSFSARALDNSPIRSMMIGSTGRWFASHVRALASASDSPCLIASTPRPIRASRPVRDSASAHGHKPAHESQFCWVISRRPACLPEWRGIRRGRTGKRFARDGVRPSQSPTGGTEAARASRVDRYGCRGYVRQFHLGTVTRAAPSTQSLPAGRTPLPCCCVAESPRSSRILSAKPLSFSTISGCFSATSLVSPGSVSRSHGAKPILRVL